MEAAIRFGAHEVLWAPAIIKADGLGRGSTTRHQRHFFCDLYERVTSLHDKARERYSAAELRALEAAGRAWELGDPQVQGKPGGDEANGRYRVARLLATLGFTVRDAAAYVQAPYADMLAVWPAHPEQLSLARRMLRDGAKHQAVVDATGLRREALQQLAAVAVGWKPRKLRHMTEHERRRVLELASEGVPPIQIFRTVVAETGDSGLTREAVNMAVRRLRDREQRRALAVSA